MDEIEVEKHLSAGIIVSIAITQLELSLINAKLQGYAECIWG